MTGVEEVVELANRDGVRLWRDRGRIKSWPAGRASTSLRTAGERTKPLLLDALPPAPPRFGLEPGRCFDCGTDLPGRAIIGLCFACRAIRNPEAQPVENARAPSREPLRIIVESRQIAAGPLKLTPWCRIVDPEKCVTADLARLEKLVERYAVVCDDPTRQDEAGDIADEIEERVDRLAHCGVRVVITETH